MNEIASKLRTMKTELGLSNKELSDLSSVPIGTVNRVLAGRVETPNFQTIRDLVKAMGGSLDDIAGFLSAAAEDPADIAEQPKQNTSQPEQPERPAAALSPEAIHIYDALLQEKQNEIESKDRWLKRLFSACCVLVGIIIAILIFDLVNPSVGFFLR